MTVFFNLLVLITPDNNYFRAALKAAELVDKERGCIHLVYVINREKEAMLNKGLEIADTIKKTLLKKKSKLNINTIAFTDDKRRSILNQYMQDKKIDLIIKLNKSQSQINIIFSRLLWKKRNEEHIFCNVLYLHKKSLGHVIKSILIPITNNNIPKEKLSLAAAIARDNHARIHLLATTGPDGNSGEIMEGFYHAYKTLLLCGFDVQYQLVPSGYSDKKIFAYAAESNTDLLLMDYVQKRKLSNIFRTPIQYLLKNAGIYPVNILFVK